MAATLYHCLGSRSFRVLWALEEAEIPYSLKIMTFPPRETERGYLSINPLGTVPTFFDDAVRMTESAAIVQYIAERYAPEKLAIPMTERAYATYLNFLHMGEATLTFPQTIFFRYTELEPKERRQPQVAADYRRWFLSRLKNASSLFEDHAYICGERFTAADISVGYALKFASALGMASEFSPGIMKYWERLTTRGAYGAACDIEMKASLDQGIDVPDFRP